VVLGKSSSDTEKIYSNIPKADIVNIISTVLESNTEININIGKEILLVLQTVAE
jgi:hypothetical protein